MTDRLWLPTLVAFCQRLAGQAMADSPDTCFATLRQAIVQLPATLTLADRMLARGIVGDFADRLMSGTGDCAGTPTVVRLGVADVRDDAWRDRWIAQFDLQRVDVPSASTLTGFDPLLCVDRRVLAALNFIDSHYQDPCLCLQGTAVACGLSPWYLSRLLKKHTRQSFPFHLRQARITATKTLLVKTALQLKEIAARVGYRGSTVLGRHFVQVCGITPLEIRHQDAQAHGFKDKPTYPIATTIIDE